MTTALWQSAFWFAATDPECWAVLSGGLCVWLTVRQNVWCWPTGIVSVALYVRVFFRAKLYADMGLQIVYVVLSFYGWYHWLFPGGRREELPVTRVSRREGLVLFAIGLVAAPAMGQALASRTDAALPFWDSLTVVMSLIAQWLLTRKVLENWHVWIVADVIMVGIYLAKGLYPTTGLYVAYTALAISGLLEWRASMPNPR